MSKHFKAIVSVFMAVTMLMSISISAMAAEQVHVMNESEVVLQNTEATALAGSSRSGGISQSSIYLTANRFVSFSFIISGNARTVQHRLVGN